MIFKICMMILMLFWDEDNFCLSLGLTTFV